jgi:hypothetical protein
MKMKIPRYKKDEIRDMVTGKLGYEEETKTGFIGRITKEGNYSFFYKGNKFFIRCTIPKGTNELPPGTQNSIIKQLMLGLDKKKITGLVDCSFSRKEYINFLISKGYIK